MNKKMTLQQRINRRIKKIDYAPKYIMVSIVHKVEIGFFLKQLDLNVTWVDDLSWDGFYLT